MGNFKENEYIIDWRLLLVNYYKNLYLNENEVMIILMSDLCLKRGVKLVSPDTLALKMNLKVADIDVLYSQLESRGYIVNKVIDGVFQTSIEGIKDALMSQFFLENNKKKEVNEASSDSIYSLFENEFSRPLTPLEIDTIREWFEQGFSVDLIKSALASAIKSNARSIRYVDKILLNYRMQEELKKEGHTTLSENWRKDISETMNIAKTRWIDDDEM